MQGYKGVIFDFDGVIVDSEYYWPLIENEYLIKNCKNWSNELYDKLIGKSLPEVHEFIKTFGFRPSYKEYSDEYKKMGNLVYGKLCTINGPILNLIYNLKSTDVKIAIASSTPKSIIKTVLHRLKVENYVFDDNIFTTDQTPKKLSKPNPEIYNFVIGKMHLTNNSFAVEDSKSGVISAKKAGLTVVGIRNGYNQNQDIKKSDFVLNCLDEEFNQLFMGCYNG